MTTETMNMLMPFLLIWLLLTLLGVVIGYWTAIRQLSRRRNAGFTDWIEGQPIELRDEITGGIEWTIPDGWIEVTAPRPTTADQGWMQITES